MQPYSLDITLKDKATLQPVTAAALAAAVPFGTDRGRWLFTAIGADVYINLGDASTISAAISSGNYNFVILSGQSLVVRLQPDQHFFNVIASGAGNLSYVKVGN